MLYRPRYYNPFKPATWERIESARLVLETNPDRTEIVMLAISTLVEIVRVGGSVDRLTAIKLLMNTGYTVASSTASSSSNTGSL